MQPRRRLKLAAVLLLVAGLIGGVAFWQSEPPLNSEELRLVGAWTCDVDGQHYIIEYDSDRNCSYLEENIFVREYWHVTGDELIVSVSSNGTRIPLPVELYNGVAEFLPIIKRFAMPNTTECERFRIRWHGDDEVTLIVLDSESNDEELDPASFTMRRVSQEK